MRLMLPLFLASQAADLCFRYKGLGGRLVPALLGALGMIAALMVFAWTSTQPAMHLNPAQHISHTLLVILHNSRVDVLAVHGVALHGGLLPHLHATRLHHLRDRAEVQQIVGIVAQCFVCACVWCRVAHRGVVSRPRGAASVQACFYSFHNLCGFVVLNAGPILIEKTSIRWAFSGYSLLIVAICVPLFFLLCSWTGIYKVEDMGKSNSSGSGSSGDELVLSETTPLKQVVVHVTPSR